jgi:hypothetical protein
MPRHPVRNLPPWLWGYVLLGLGVLALCAMLLSAIFGQ